MLNYFKAIGQRCIRTKLMRITNGSISIGKNIKPKIVPIQTLTELIESKQKMENPKFDKIEYQPSELNLNVIRALKINIYQIPEESIKIINAINRYKDDMAYLKHFVKLLLPVDQMWPQLNKTYLDLAITYMKQQTIYKKQQLFYLLENLQRMITRNRSEWIDQDWLEKDYTKEQQLANLLVPRLIQNKNLFDITFFMRLVKICDMLQIGNPELAQFLVTNIDSNTIRVKMAQIINILSYLARFYRLPYQYFYENKKKWINTISSYNKFSTKKSIESIKMFQLIVLQNPMHCQLLLKKLQDIIVQALPSFDHDELVNVWYTTNRAKFGIQQKLIQKMIQKLTELVSGMEVRQFCLVVRGFANFKYINQYKQESEYILKQISKNLTKQRLYEHEIVNYLLESVLKKQIKNISATN